MKAVGEDSARQEMTQDDNCTLGSDMASLVSAAERWALEENTAAVEQRSFTDDGTLIYLDPWKLSLEVAYEICKRNHWDPQTGRELRPPRVQNEDGDLNESNSQRSTKDERIVTSKTAQATDEQPVVLVRRNEWQPRFIQKYSKFTIVVAVQESKAYRGQDEHLMRFRREAVAVSSPRKADPVRNPLVESYLRRIVRSAISSPSPVTAARSITSTPYRATPRRFSLPFVSERAPSQRFSLPTIKEIPTVKENHKIRFKGNSPIISERGESSRIPRLLIAPNKLRPVQRAETVTTGKLVCRPKATLVPHKDHILEVFRQCAMRIRAGDDASRTTGV
ncbi:unnamed protein product [Toxocara canis]|uniref:Uncharacterized protein n=1 Tax=Toxocara canis TaxID=6265 RepID=A0A183UL66_TOXCA|nr:unnamed protein product [Toxocara canis]